MPKDRLKNYLQKRFINLLAKDLFNTVGRDDILRVENGKVFYRGKELDKDTVTTLKENASAFKNSTLWRILSNELKYIHNLRMFDKSLCDDDMLAGKLGLYNLDLIEKKLEDISRL